MEYVKIKVLGKNDYQKLLLAYNLRYFWLGLFVKKC